METQFDRIERKIAELDEKIDKLPSKIPGHFWIIILLLIIAFKVGAC